MPLNRLRQNVACCLGAAALASGLAWAAPPQIHCAPTIPLTLARRAIDQGNGNWIKAWKTQDATLIARQFAPSGAEFGGRGRVTRGRVAIQQHYQEVFKASGPADVQVITEDVWLLDGEAYETGKYVYTFAAKTPGGAPETESGHYVTVWQRQKDGSWKIHADMGVPGD